MPRKPEELAECIAAKIKKKSLRLIPDKTSDHLRSELFAAAEFMSGDDDEKYDIDFISKVYEQRYNSLPKAEKGTSRNVNESTTMENYRFDQYYPQKNFANSRINVQLRDPSKRTPDFILHMGVAFMLKPETLDKLLTENGFYQLHVKNIHHLAIYATLAVCTDEMRKNPNYNPFANVKKLYESALEIINAGSEESAPETSDVTEQYAFVDGKTTLIREYLVGKRNLTPETMLGYVSRHKEIYTFRHSKLVREHGELMKRLALDRDAQTGSADEKYTLKSFIMNYCKNVTDKRYNEGMSSFIHSAKRKNVLHPTREIMIVLWLFDFCLNKDYSSGIAIKAAINEKLNDYHFLSLSSVTRFDTVILECLNGLSDIECDTNQNFSRALTAVIKTLDAVKEILIKEKGSESDKDDIIADKKTENEPEAEASDGSKPRKRARTEDLSDILPLACDLYEQL